MSARPSSRRFPRSSTRCWAWNPPTTRARTSSRCWATSPRARRRFRSAAGLARSCAASSRAASGSDEGMNELRSILSDVVTRLFTERVTRELSEAAEQGEWPGTLWQAVEENGLTLPLVPEAKGGGGGTWGDAYVVVSAAGRHAVPLPLPETIVAAWLLAGADLEVPTGPLALAPAQRDDDVRLTPATGGWRLSGTARRVPWGGSALHVVVVTAVDGRAM